MSLDLTLYLILDAQQCGSPDAMLNTATIAAQHGISLIQLRADHTWHKRQWYNTAYQLKQLLIPYNVPLIINDQVDIALAIDADGVHIGQNDLPVAAARRLLGAKKWLGMSVSNREELEQLDNSLIDYIGIGPIFPTLSKSDAAPPMGLSGLREIVQHKQSPAVAIGGINASNAASIRQTGVDGIAVISAICGQKDIASACQTLLTTIKVPL